MLLAMTMHILYTSAQQVVFVKGGSMGAWLVDMIDSLRPRPASCFDVYYQGVETPRCVEAETLLFNNILSDTLHVHFEENATDIVNPDLMNIDADIQPTVIEIRTNCKKPLVCKFSGVATNQRIVIRSDTVVTLVLDNLSLVSEVGCCISLPNKHKVFVELPKHSYNKLIDAVTYNLKGDDEADGAIYARGSLYISGEGELAVQGRYKHAIATKKNVYMNSGHVSVLNTEKSGISCDDFIMTGGTVSLNITKSATKGIKTKETFNMTGGSITATAYGEVKIGIGDNKSFCTLIKSDGIFTMSGGNICMQHFGSGGRCISVDNNMTVTGGILRLETHGNGEIYMTSLKDSDYYVPKCINVDRSLRIERGTIDLLSTGRGGKGIDCSDSLIIGRPTDGFLSNDSLSIKVETYGAAMIYDIVSDYITGCPKAIKGGNDVELFSGNIIIATHGSGGEGIESKGDLRTYSCTIVADTYDDGISSTRRIVVDGSHIYCHSINNDGIDSNGKMTVFDGIVAAVSEHETDESIDTDNGRLYIYGGCIIGIGNDRTDIGYSQYPYYSTQQDTTWIFFHKGDSIHIDAGRYLTVSQGKNAILSLHHYHSSDNIFITVASPRMEWGQEYAVSDGPKPDNPDDEWFGGKCVIGGMMNEYLDHKK